MSCCACCYLESTNIVLCCDEVESPPDKVLSIAYCLSYFVQDHQYAMESLIIEQISYQTKLSIAPGVMISLVAGAATNSS